MAFCPTDTRNGSQEMVFFDSLDSVEQRDQTLMSMLTVEQA